jgi:hypothetical protein
MPTSNFKTCMPWLLWHCTDDEVTSSQTHAAAERCTNQCPDKYKSLLESSRAFSYNALSSRAGGVEEGRLEIRKPATGCSTPSHTSTVPGSSRAGHKLGGVGEACKRHRGPSMLKKRQSTMPKHKAVTATAAQQCRLRSPFWFHGSAKWSCRDEGWKKHGSCGMQSL